MNLFVSTSDTGTKYEISGVIWQVAPESKTQLVSCKLFPEYLLGISRLEYISAINAYIFHDSFCSVILSDALSILVDLNAPVFVFSVLQWPIFFWIFRFWTICDPVILLPTPESHIWISIVTFSKFIFGVTRIEIWTEFLISLYFSLLLKTIFSWVWYSTMTAIWVRKIFSFYSSYWIILIQVINL